MIEEQMRFEQEKQKLKKREDKRMKEEQKKILGKGNARPKLSFSLGANSQHLAFYNFSSGVSWEEGWFNYTRLYAQEFLT